MSIVNHIEGDYEEIVKYLDDRHPWMLDSSYAMSHGDPEAFYDWGHNLNFGLFSIVDDARFCAKCRHPENNTDHDIINSGQITLEEWDRTTEELVRYRLSCEV